MLGKPVFPKGAKFALYDDGHLVGRRKVRQSCNWTAGREIDWAVPPWTSVLLARPSKYGATWCALVHGKQVIETPHTNEDAALMHILLQV